jgi:Bardet-Biedl syndrome 2 protein
MGLAGDVVQDLCHALDVSELETECDFPDEFEELGKTLDAVTELNALRMRLTAEMADSTNEVKALIIRAEDARMLGDMAQMRSAFRELHGLNGELIREYEKRSTNHQTLLKTLKGVNQAIQKAARLRCGKAKANVVKACRKAVKKNNLQRLLSIIREGA